MIFCSLWPLWLPFCVQHGFFCCFLDFSFDFWLSTVWWWSTQSWFSSLLNLWFAWLSLLGFAELTESVNLCLSLNLGDFQPLNLQIFFLSHSFASLSGTLITYIGSFYIARRSLRICCSFSSFTLLLLFIWNNFYWSFISWLPSSVISILLLAHPLYFQYHIFQL